MNRQTVQRHALRRVFERKHRPLTANEVLQAAQERLPKIGIATVYRNIKTLVEEGWLVPVELPGEPLRYERADQAHHHHFHCEICAKVFDVPGCSGALEGALPAGFRAKSHEVVIYGTCATCLSEKDGGLGNRSAADR